MFGIGMPELSVIVVIVLLLFGPTKLPALGKSLGEAIRGFKKAVDEPEPTDLERCDNPEKSRESAKS
jgi:sec-independent protein translocase protein TatA